MLKKYSLIIFMLSLVLSCVKNYNYLITSKGIGKYKLNEVLVDDFSRDEFNIKVDSKKRITTIITLSNKFKTEDNLRVGSNFKDIRLLSDNLKEGEMSLSKGSKKKWDIGKTIVYKNVLFIDNDEDNLVDMIMISNE